MVKQLAEIEVGGSEEEAKERVKAHFRKSLEPDKQYKNLSTDELKELEDMYEQDNAQSNNL